MNTSKPTQKIQKAVCFLFDAQGVRVVGTPDQPWFVAQDVCAALGLPNASLAINGRADRDESGLDPDEKGVATVNTLGGAQEMLIINESGLYALIFRSRKPQAKVFRKWVTHEVLPQIRKTGAYVPPPAPSVLDIRRAEIGALPPPAGWGLHAMLANGTPDLSTDDMRRLLNAALGEEDIWTGQFADLVAIALRERLFYWAIQERNQGYAQRVSFGRLIALRAGLDYCGTGRTHVFLAIVGKGRHKKFVIKRREGELVLLEKSVA